MLSISAGIARSVDKAMSSSGPSTTSTGCVSFDWQLVSSTMAMSAEAAQKNDGTDGEKSKRSANHAEHAAA